MSPEQPSANASGRQFARNAVASYVNLVVGILLSLILTRVLLHHLGTGVYGLWVVLIAIVGYIGLLDAGVSSAVVQRVARLLATGDGDGLADIIRTSTVFFTASGALAVLITVVLAPFLASLLHLGDVDNVVAGSTLILLGAMTACKFLTSVPSAILFGSGRSDRLSQVGLAGMLVTQLAQIGVVLAGGGLVALGAVSVAGALLSLTASSYVARRVTGTSIRRGKFRRSILTDLLRFGGRNTAISVSGIVAYSLDALVIGIIRPVAQVAPYDIGLSAANLTRSLTTQGTDLLLPTYAHFETVADPDRQAHMFARSVMVTLTVSIPMLIALGTFGEPILKLWLGSVPPQSYAVMIALGIVTILQLPGHQCFVFLTGVGRNQLMIRISIISATVNLIGSVLATFRFGPVGPAIGSMPPVLVIDFFILPIMVCRYVGMPVRVYARTALAPVIPAVLTAGLVAIAFKFFYPIPAGTGTFHAGVQAVISAAVVVLLAWGTMFAITLRIEPEFRSGIVAKIRRRKG
jgi:O-antigen/teichoic acid export membrane protein